VALDADALDMSDPVRAARFLAFMEYPVEQVVAFLEGRDDFDGDPKEAAVRLVDAFRATASATSPLPSSRRTRRHERTTPVARLRRSMISHDRTGHEARKEQHMATLAPVAPGTLTEKQHEVYELIRKADGVIDNQAIAKRLGTTPNNVAQHVRKMRERGILPEKAARSNGGQRSLMSRRRSATRPPAPPRPPRRTRRTRRTRRLVHRARQRRGHDQAQKFLDQARARKDEVANAIVELDRQREEYLAAIDGSGGSS
jgi:DNA-binding CsgD family transcriptional regulator